MLAAGTLNAHRGRAAARGGARGRGDRRAHRRPAPRRARRYRRRARQPPPRRGALEIMRRSDIGPMGVGALVLVLLIQVAAVAAVPRLPLAVAALVLAEVTGRVSVVVATSSPAARPGGFGALVAGRTTAAERALTVGALACAVAAAGLTAGGPALAGTRARRHAGRPARRLAAAADGAAAARRDDGRRLRRDPSGQRHDGAGRRRARRLARRDRGEGRRILGALRGLEVSASCLGRCRARRWLVEADRGPGGRRGGRGEDQQDPVVGDELGGELVVRRGLRGRASP